MQCIFCHLVSRARSREKLRTARKGKLPYREILCVKLQKNEGTLGTIWPKKHLKNGGDIVILDFLKAFHLSFIILFNKKQGEYY